MKSFISVSSLVTLALTLATSAEATRSCKDKNGSCKVLGNNGFDGFWFKFGSGRNENKVCVPENWKCGKHGVSCDQKPVNDYCPTGYNWFEHHQFGKSWKLCVPTSGNNDDDDDDPDCLEGATWKDGRCCQDAPPSGQTCNTNTHFWWAGGARCGKATANRCVPRTLPSKAVTPPAGETSSCCPKSWHWFTFGAFKICVPDSPKLPDCRGKPSCPNTHWWNGDKGCCNKKQKKRDLSASGEILAIGAPDDLLCPSNLTSCPIQGAEGSYECIDPASELESCGGCTSMGKGQDCTAISGASSVGCEAGVCKVYSCASGYLSNNSCVQ